MAEATAQRHRRAGPLRAGTAGGPGGGHRRAHPGVEQRARGILHLVSCIMAFGGYGPAGDDCVAGPSLGVQTHRFRDHWSVSRGDQWLPRRTAYPDGMQRTATVQHPITETRRPQAELVGAEATALHTTVDRCHPHPALSQGRGGPWRCQRQLLATSRPQAVHWGQRAGQAAQIRYQPTPSGHGMRRRLGDARLLGTAAGGLTPAEDGGGGPCPAGHGCPCAPFSGRDHRPSVQPQLGGGRCAVRCRHGHTGGPRRGGRCRGWGGLRMRPRPCGALRDATPGCAGGQRAGGGLAAGAPCRLASGPQDGTPVLRLALAHPAQASWPDLAGVGLQVREPDEQPGFRRRPGAVCVDGTRAGGSGRPLEAPRRPLRGARGRNGREQALTLRAGQTGEREACWGAGLPSGAPDPSQGPGRLAWSWAGSGTVDQKSG